MTYLSKDNIFSAGKTFKHLLLHFNEYNPKSIYLLPDEKNYSNAGEAILNTEDIFEIYRIIKDDNVAIEAKVYGLYAISVAGELHEEDLGNILTIPLVLKNRDYDLDRLYGKFVREADKEEKMSDWLNSFKEFRHDIGNFVNSLKGKSKYVKSAGEYLSLTEEGKNLMKQLDEEIRSTNNDIELKIINPTSFRNETFSPENAFYYKEFCNQLPKYIEQIAKRSREPSKMGKITKKGTHIEGRDIISTKYSVAETYKENGTPASIDFVSGGKVTNYGNAILGIGNGKLPEEPILSYFVDLGLLEKPTLKGLDKETYRLTALGIKAMNKTTKHR